MSCVRMPLPPLHDQHVCAELCYARCSQDPERKDSDLWGSRGVFLAGAMNMYMAVMNFKNTVVRRAALGPDGRPPPLFAPCAA